MAPIRRIYEWLSKEEPARIVYELQEIDEETGLGVLLIAIVSDPNGMELCLVSAETFEPAIRAAANFKPPDWWAASLRRPLSAANLRLISSHAPAACARSPGRSARAWRPSMPPRGEWAVGSATISHRAADGTTSCDMRAVEASLRAGAWPRPSFDSYLVDMNKSRSTAVNVNKLNLFSLRIDPTFYSEVQPAAAVYAYDCPWQAAATCYTAK